MEGHHHQYHKFELTEEDEKQIQECKMSLADIQRELYYLTQVADSGGHIDERRYDFLLRVQEINPEYRAMVEAERKHWQESIHEFILNCLERTRTFVPPNIFDCSYEDLVKIGISGELAKRVLQRQCLWLVRMSKDEISRLHESDLIGRFNSQAQNLDIIEIGAVYASLPDTFLNDNSKKKEEWKVSIEDTLREMLLANDEDLLETSRIRNPAYGNLSAGPIKDITTVRQVDVIRAEDPNRPDKDHLILCSTNTILKQREY